MVAEPPPAFPIRPGLSLLFIPLSIEGVECGPLASQSEVKVGAVQFFYSQEP
jgi:hypothetical protein